MTDAPFIRWMPARKAAPRHPLFWIGAGAIGFGLICAAACVWTVMS